MKNDLRPLFNREFTPAKAGREVKMIQDNSIAREMAICVLAEIIRKDSRQHHARLFLVLLK